MAYAVPAFVQAASGSNTGDRLDRVSPAQSVYHFAFPQPCQAGNCIIIGTQANSGTTFTASDDKGNVYSTVATRTALTHTGAILVATNIASGTQYLQVTGGTADKQVVIHEWTNISGVDVSSNATGTSTAITAGPLTPTQNGDLIWQVAYQMSQNRVYTAGPAAADPNITYVLKTCSDPQGRVQIVQTGIYGSTATLTPTLRQSVSGPFLSLAVALKGEAQGSAAPAGMRILSVQHQTLYSSNKPSGPGFPPTCPLHFPCSGNLRIALIFQAGFSRITSVTDNKGNTWQKAGPGTGATQHFADTWYTSGGTVGSDTVVTVVDDDTQEDSSVIFFDVTGAATTNVHDVSIGQNGNISPTFPVHLVGPTITPTAAGIAFGQLNHSWGTAISMAGPSGAVFDGTYDEKANIDGPVGNDQNGGYAHVAYAAAGAQAFNWTYFDSTWSGQNDYTAYVSAFKAGAIVAPTATPAALIIRNVNG